MPFGFIGSLISGGASLLGAGMQSSATNAAINAQQQQFAQTQQNLLPFLQAGQNLLPQLLGMLGPGGQLSTNPQTTMGPAPTYSMPAFTAQMYQASPGYNATLQGGTQVLQNAGATTTGALSGNVLKALQGYGTGLANADFQQGYQNYASNYQNQFNANNQNYWSTLGQSDLQNQNMYQWLQTLIGSGQNAGASLGSLGQNSVNNIGNALIGQGGANAAGIVGAGKAAVGGLNNLSTMQNTSGGNSNDLLSTLMYGTNPTGGLDPNSLSYLDQIPFNYSGG